MAQFKKEVEINGQKVGPGHTCFIIAEAGVNHNGDMEMARRLVAVAAEAEADAVKFQTFKSTDLLSNIAPKAQYQLESTGESESQLEMLQKLELSPQEHRELQAYCEDLGILFLSTPFDHGSVDLLHELGVPAFKIGSGELTNWPLLEDVASRAKPMIVSTGMAYLSEVDEAVRVVRDAGCDQLVLLHCISNYPADSANANLRAMQTLAAAFDLPVGYSDHTLGIDVTLAAVALGACMIEKHFTLDANLPGPDHGASLEPSELKAMVQGIRVVESALGHGRKEPGLSEIDTANVARKSLVAARAIPPGTKLTQDMIAIKRPGTGLPPRMLTHLVGRTLKTGVQGDDLLELGQLE